MGVSAHPVVWEYSQASLTSIQNAASAIDFSSTEKQKTYHIPHEVLIKILSGLLDSIQMLQQYTNATAI